MIQHVITSDPLAHCSIYKKITHHFLAGYTRIVSKTIILTGKQDEWIKAQIDTKRYIDDSEYIRDLVRLEQERRAETEDIRSTLNEGENSGEPQPFDAVSHLTAWPLFASCMAGRLPRNILQWEV